MPSPDLSHLNIEASEYSIEFLPSSQTPNLDDSFAVLVIKGEFNLYSAQSLKETLDILIAQHSKTKIIIETSQVSYIDSSGLGVILGIHAKLVKSNGFIRIAAPSKQVNYVLELTKLKSLLSVHDTLDEATKR